MMLSCCNDVANVDVLFRCGRGCGFVLLLCYLSIVTFLGNLLPKAMSITVIIWRVVGF